MTFKEKSKYQTLEIFSGQLLKANLFALKKLKLSFLLKSLKDNASELILQAYQICMLVITSYLDRELKLTKPATI